jgi:hypothetical protein
MENLVTLAIFLVSGAAISLGMAHHGKKMSRYNAIFRDLAGQTHLKLIKGSLIFFPKLYGTIDTFGFSIEKYEGEEVQKSLMISTRFFLHIPGELFVNKGYAFSRLVSIRPRDIQAGDNEFDDLLFVDASEPYVATAYLNSVIRRLSKKLAASGTSINISKFGISLIMPFSEIHQPRKIVRCVEDMVSLCKELNREQDIRKRLMENIDADEIPEVRLRNIRALTAHFALDDKIFALLRKTMRDEMIEIQVESAAHLGVEGTVHLADILRKGGAVSGVMKLQIVNILKEHGYRESAPVLMNLYRDTKNPDLMIAVLDAFFVFGDERVGPLLMEQLDAENADVRMHAVRALETCGTVEAVERLLKLADDSLSPFVKNATHKSVERIQSRLGNVEKGWLSMPESQGKQGALSMAGGAEEGSLSMEKAGGDGSREDHNEES